ncbi:hypothetical protein JAAARDRAFT_408354 [Jaapia argillacea MUCL 33604]|uniref:UGGT thioredoxin-like domain-containing protein n=1 Tax=Jaapia argillacea MUCL 33604 TaxID=933084 RepID=A0A067PI51_9AGAM|nr:hypothetical protein JAAARDRAFT_408354 [Jaapia argillacea MUCL 33604]
MLVIERGRWCDTLVERLRKGSRSEKWGESPEVLLRRSYLDAFPRNKHNLFNMVAVLNRSKTSSINFLSQAVSGIIQKGFGFRWGGVCFTM